MVHYKLLAMFLALVFALTACREKTFTNQDQYDIAIGETVEIYYTTNSCCYYCILNNDEMKHLGFVEEKVVKDYPRGCDGCNATSAFVFKATSAGTDTVKLRFSEAGKDCITAEYKPEVFVVNVK